MAELSELKPTALLEENQGLCLSYKLEVAQRVGQRQDTSAHLLIRYYTFTPVSMPVVETLKSRYANISGVGGL